MSAFAKSKKMNLFFVALLSVTFLIVFDFVQNDAAKSEPRECPFPTEETDLSYCDFTGVDFGDENLAFKDLTGANLSDSKLAKTNLTMVKSGKLTGIPQSLPPGWVIRNGYLIGVGADLGDAELSGADLQKINLEGSNLSGANLSGANLSEANISGASLQNTNFDSALMDNTLVSQSSFKDSNLRGAKISNLAGTPINVPPGYNFRFGTILGPEVDFYKTDFSNKTLTNESLAGSSFTSAKLFRTYCNYYASGCQGYGYDRPLVIQWSNLEGANFTGLRLESNRIGDSDLSFAKLNNLTANKVTFENVVLDGTDFSNSTFQYSTFDNLDFSKATLGNTSFYGSKLRNTDFSGMDLSNVNFLCADLSKSRFVGSDLSGLDLSCSDLSGAVLTDAKIEGTKFAYSDWGSPRGTKLGSVKSGGLTGVPLNLPPEWSLKKGQLIGPEANLEGADLSGLNLNTLNLSGSNMIGSKLTNTSLVGTNLNGVLLKNSNITNAFFSSTTSIDGLESGGLIGSPRTLPTGWTSAGGFLFLTSSGLRGMDLSGTDFSNSNLHMIDFEGSNLSNANFSGSDLTGASLNFATLLSTNISGADLSGVKLDWISSGNLIGSPKGLPESWKIAGGYLLGPRARLNGKDLSGLDLSFANLDSAELEYANLSSAILNGTNLSGTRLSGANLDGIQSSNLIGSPRALPQEWKIAAGYLLGPRANLMNSSFSNMELRSINLADSNLNNSTFSNVTLEGVLIDNASIQGTIFSNITVRSNLSARDLDGEPKSLPSGWKLVKGHLIAPGSNLSNLDLSEQDLKGLDCSRANFENSNLSGSDMQDLKAIGANFRNSNLKEVNFKNTNLDEADLSQSNIVGSDFTGSSLFGTVFSGVVFGESAPFEESNIYFSTIPRVGDSIRVVGDQMNKGMVLDVRWYVNGKLRQSGQASPFAVTPQDLGKTLQAFGYVVLPCQTCTNHRLADIALSGLVIPGTIDLILNIEISNPPKVGETVSVKPVVVPEGVSVVYKWFEGTRLVYEGSSLSVPSSLLGKALKVDAIFSKLGYTSQQIESDSFIVAKGLMEKPQLQIEGFQEVGEELDAWIANEDGGAEYSYQWFRDGVVIPFEVSKFYKVKAQDVGRLLGVKVSVARQGFDGAVAVVNLNKVIPGPKIAKFSIPKVDGKPNVGQSITVNVGAWVSNTKFQIQWFKNMQPIANANSKTLALSVEDVGSDISVQVTGTKIGFLPKVVTSSKVKVLPGALQAKTPKVVGQPKVGSTLTAEASPWTSGAVISYQWLLDGKPIKKATQQNFVILKDQKGKSISVVVTQTASGFLRASKTSASQKVK